MKGKTNKNRRGSALLLTLGVLSMALVLGMCFAFTARTSMQVAQVNADQIKARLMAESTLARVITIIRAQSLQNANSSALLYSPESQVICGHSFVDQDSSIEVATTENQQRVLRFMMSTCTQAGDKETGLRNELITASSSLPWVELLDGNTNIPANSGMNYGMQPVTDTSGNLVGRVGFIVIDDTDKLDINQMMEQNATPGSFNSPFIKDGENKFATLNDDFDSGTDFTYNLTPNANGHIDSSQSAPQTIRLGQALREIWFSKREEYFNARKTRDAAKSKYVPFSSYRHIAISNPGFRNRKEYLKYTFFSGQDYEAYRDGLQEYQRFDITGDEWRGRFSNGWEPTDIGTRTAKQLKEDLVEALTNNNANRPAFNTNICLPTTRWSSDEGTDVTNSGFGLKAIHANKQAAANMVDFCDSDNFATLPSDFSDPLEKTTPAPDYCGNEAVPYVNEIAADFRVFATMVSQSDTTTYPGGYSLQYFLQMSDLKLELLNIYPHDFPEGQVTLRLYCKLRGTIGDDAETDLPLDGGKEYLEATYTYAAGTGVHFVTTTSVSGVPATDAPIPLHTTENNLKKDKKVTYKLTFTRIVAVTHAKNEAPSNSNIYDYALWDAGAEPITVELNDVNEMNNVLNAKHGVIDAQVTDPRINHKSGQNYWLVRTDDKDLESSPKKHTLGAVNSNFVGGTDYTYTPPTETPIDVESAANLTFADNDHTFSTAFIPNRPFENIWELGCIHTGTPFKTLDLLDNHRTLLDMVKIGPLRERKDTYNPNAQNPGVAFELFKNIKPSRGYLGSSSNPPGKNETDGPLGTGTTEPSSLNSFKFLDSHSYNRSDVAKYLKYLIDEAPTKPSWVSSMTTKREREAWIGRTIGLLSTRNRRYTILVTADALRPIQLPTGVEWSTIRANVANAIYNESESFNIPSAIIGKHRILAHVVQDTWSGAVNIVKLTYIDWDN